MSNQPPPIEQRLAALVQMITRDLGTMQNALNGALARIAALEGRAQAHPAPAMHGMSDEDTTIVGIHPISGRGVTAKQLKEDPKLAMRMKFAESDES